jgi:hypothetical protein
MENVYKFIADHNELSGLTAAVLEGWDEEDIGMEPDEGSIFLATYLTAEDNGFAELAIHLLYPEIDEKRASEIISQDGSKKRVGFGV